MCVMKNSPYPCGRCYECLSRKRSDWSLRIQEQAKVMSCFHAILTYDNSHLPTLSDGTPTLSKRDLQLFFKRLRHHYPDNSLKYFVAGEYGSRRGRPHYHALIFGIPFQDKYSVISTIQVAWQLGEVRRRSRWFNSLINGQLIINSAGLHYVTKDIINFAERDSIYDESPYKPVSFSNNHHFFVDHYTFSSPVSDKIPIFETKLPTFILASKGLGISYVEKHKKEFSETQLNVAACAIPAYVFLDTAVLRARSCGGLSLFSRQMSLNKAFDVSLTDGMGNWLPNPLLANIRDFIEYQMDVLNYNDHKYHLKTVRLAMPRYWRDKLFPKVIRDALNRLQAQKRQQSDQDYYKEYGEYDITHDVPMYLLQGRQKYKAWHKANKDRFEKRLHDDTYFD